MMLLKLVFSLLSGNLRPLFLWAVVFGSISGVYYTAASYFEQRAALRIINSQAKEVHTKRKRCNKVTTTYLTNSAKLNEELSNVQHYIYERKNDTWSRRRLPTDVERLLEQ